MTAKNPVFHLYVGPMFGGKTGRLLQTAERLKYQHQSFVAFKPKRDVRYSNNEIVTHLGAKLSAISVIDGSEILDYIAESDVDYHHILIDELFMITGGADALVWLYRMGVSVYASSIDLSYALEPFSEVKAALPWATHVEKCSAVCTSCGQDAFFTYRKTDDDLEIVVGGAETYEPRCAKCHPKFKET